MNTKKALVLIGLATSLTASSMAVFAEEGANKHLFRNFSTVEKIKSEDMQEKMQERLLEALESGKISQEEYDKILDGSFEGKIFGPNKENFKGERKELTEEEKEQMQEKMQEHRNLIEKLRLKKEDNNEEK